MKIMVVDDQVDAEDLVRAALASGPAAGLHSVRGVISPAGLRTVDDLGSYRLAFVDMMFLDPGGDSGLLALRLLEKAGVPVVIYSAAAENNRLLFLLAAFQFFRPRGLVPKGASSAEIQKLVRAVESDMWPDFPAAECYRPPAVGMSKLDRLIIRPSCLPIWRALAEYTSRTAIAEAAGVSASKVDDFLIEHYDIVMELDERSQLRASPQPLPDLRLGRTKAAQAYSRRVTPLYSFALVHRRFFADPELERQIALRDEPPPLPRGARRRPRR
jgi:CheY-like chemotaxis protein